MGKVRDHGDGLVWIRRGYGPGLQAGEGEDMQVNALDHVNIGTCDLDASARFYAEILNLDARPAPGLPADAFRWLYDSQGRAVVHLRLLDCGDGPTGAIHHVAFACSGKAELCARLEARGIGYRVNRLEAAGLDQVFFKDPHGILLELNFVGE